MIQWRIVSLGILHTLTKRWEVPASEIPSYEPKYGKEYCAAWEAEYDQYLNAFWLPREVLIVIGLLYFAVSHVDAVMSAARALAGINIGV